MECTICNKTCKNTKGLSGHLKLHNMTLVEYLNMSRDIEKCPYCGADCKPRGSRFTVTCASKECLSKHSRNRLHTEVTISMIRNKRIEYLKKRTGKTAWEKRSRKEMSYLESWFQDEIILKHELNARHQIITEHHVGGYFIDFAFLDKMIAVEIDGRCHFDKNMNRRESDLRKDKLLTEMGWKVIRMNFHDIRHSPNLLIEKFLNYLSSSDSQSLDWIGQIRYGEYNKIKNDLLKEKINLENEEKLRKIQSKIDKIKSSNIDFSKHGWVQNVSALIEMTPQKTRMWLEKHAPDLIEKSFKRKTRI